MKKTPLYDQHLQAGARMAPFGDWEMPIQYEGILKEHSHTRQQAALFDTCHMGEFELSGPSAASDLDRLLTMPVPSLESGQCKYGYLLNDQGGVLDDLTCYRLNQDTFYLVVNAGTRDRDAEWIRQRLSEQTCFDDSSDRTAKIDIQGPCSREVLSTFFPVPELGFFRCNQMEWNGMTLMLSRSGYTGEWGYELYFPAEYAAEVWQNLLADPRVNPAGLGARDTLRLEMGYPLYGHELSEDRSPVAADRGRFCSADKAFIGCEQVRRDLERGCEQVLCGLLFESRKAARAGDRVLVNAESAGVITSGAPSPSLNRAIAMAYVDAAHTAVDTVLEVEVRNSRIPAKITALPFFKEGTARKKRS